MDLSKESALYMTKICASVLTLRNVEGWRRLEA